MARSSWEVATARRAPKGFQWTSEGGLVGLGDLPGGDFGSAAYSVSGDGLTVVGTSRSWQTFYFPYSVTEAFRWTSAGGMVALGDLPGGVFASGARAISGDGSTIVGGGSGVSGYEAFRCVGCMSPGGMVGLGDLPGGSFGSGAISVSGDGSTVVGQGTSESGQEAFLWTSNGGMVGLGDLAGGDFHSVATDVSGDGSVVVGEGNSASGYETFLWDATNGMRELHQLLTGFGLNLTGWRLDGGASISADGQTIVASGTNPSGVREAWLAVVPREPVAGCGDGIVQMPEECDDGNLASGDGCSSTCTIEPPVPAACADGIDNDGDNLTDYPADPGCGSPNDAIENPLCEDGIDNDGDGLKDALDPGCGGQGWRNSENPACADGIDNDGDGHTDSFPGNPAGDTACHDATEQSEGPDCSDGIDNDGDGLVDYSTDPGCQTNLEWAIENPGCSDGADNDRDGKIDFVPPTGSPQDPQCVSAWDPLEPPNSCGLGAELVIPLGAFLLGRRRAESARPLRRDRGGA